MNYLQKLIRTKFRLLYQPELGLYFKSPLGEPAGTTCQILRICEPRTNTPNSSDEL